MQYVYPKVVILIGFAFCISALVHYQKMEKGANGCKTKSSKAPAAAGAAPGAAPGAAAPAGEAGAAGGDAAAPAAGETAASRTGASEGTELLVGGVLKDENTCGVFVCQNTEGDALIHYCQKPAPFEMCNGDGVSTVTPFPECCWKCVTYVSCASGDAKQGQTGQEGQSGAATPPAKI
ncbi:brain acid soluble protein 1 [Drosophila virilis]|uniref:Single domain-containing protein n=1 Tax=Drosophila virilis TaxID=7244 RepID=A0A0Q9W3X7_DROVI|nr:uncharacterized protein LOC6625294 [Drosophila virilis]KRF79688.1 uncharacterized protein Dvir_GJ20562 [Drosophila virilis]